MEFSGRDQKGERVMGIVTSGALASMVLADKNLLWNVPTHWTLEDAATVPVAYGTVSDHEVKSKLGSLLLSVCNFFSGCLFSTTVWLQLLSNLLHTFSGVHCMT
jgi:hypothetical protein